MDMTIVHTFRRSWAIFPLPLRAINASYHPKKPSLPPNASNLAVAVSSTFGELKYSSDKIAITALTNLFYTLNCCAFANSQGIIEEIRCYSISEHLHGSCHLLKTRQTEYPKSITLLDKIQIISFHRWYNSKKKRSVHPKPPPEEIRGINRRIVKILMIWYPVALNLITIHYYVSSNKIMCLDHL